MTTSVEVRPVTTRREARAFVNLPYDLYRSDPNWVPPLRSEETKRWAVAHNPSLAARSTARFLVYRGADVVGRVAAIRDHAFSAMWERGAGVIGFFECAPDAAAARALLEAAELWLARRGCTRAIGPIELTTHDGTGLLVHGFDEPATVMSPYNPPYYADLLEQAGYGYFREYHAYDAGLASAPSPGVMRVVRTLERGNGAANHLRIRTIDLANWDREMETVRDLYNAAFEPVWGAVPITAEEFTARAIPLRRAIDPSLVLIAEHRGSPVGFALCLPDVNEALIHANGRLLPFGWLALLRHGSHIKTARFILLGVRPNHGQPGLGVLLAYRAREAVRAAGYTRLELSLVQAANDKVRRVIDAFSCSISKTYRLYAKKLDAPARRGIA